MTVEQLRERYNALRITEHPLENGARMFVLVCDPSYGYYPNEYLDSAVMDLVEDHMFNEYVDAEGDNPWIRIVIMGLNELIG